LKIVIITLTPELIHNIDPSFHKFAGTDPYETYDNWFRKADEELAAGTML
jgi:hypothetical protein